MITKNFSLVEFTNSTTADKLKIDNSLKTGLPRDDFIIANIRSLCQILLQPARDKYGKSIFITSGYRSPLLNEAVGGVKNSDHLNGCAADLVTDDLFKLYKILTKLPHHQIYLDKRNGFIHAAYRRHTHNSQRHWIK